MKVKIRRSCQSDLEQVYDLHVKCFSQSDHWYRANIRHYLDTGIVVEVKDTGKIVGVLLQGSITPCNRVFNTDNNNQDISLFQDVDKPKDTVTNSGYKADEFSPVTETGKYFLNESLHFKEIDGIVMICVDSEYRGKGLAKKLIEKHWTDNKNSVVCLNTRRSNVSAYMLYKKMGYEHIAYIKNKYFLPTEDSIFMIKNLKPVTETVSAS